MNKAVVLLLVLGLCALVRANAPLNGVCPLQQCADPTNPNTNRCGSSATTTAACPAGYYCVNNTGTQLNGYCTPAIADGQHGCVAPGPNGGIVPCANPYSKCNNSGYCVPNPAFSLGIGQASCQNPSTAGCHAQLVCVLNASAPPETEFYCDLPPAADGANCAGDDGICGGSYFCDETSDDQSTEVCRKRYTKGLGDKCDAQAWYECQPGLVCAGTTCSNLTSSMKRCNATAQCPSTETCACWIGGDLGGDLGYCVNEWAMPVPQAYADAEVAVLDCMFQNCPLADGYSECPACLAQTCTYWSELAAFQPTEEVEVWAINSTMFACSQGGVGLNGIPIRLDTAYVEANCPVPGSTTGSTGSAQTTNSQTTNSQTTTGASAASSVVISFVSVFSAAFVLLF